MNIYDKHDAAFRNVSAFAILKDGKHVANITLKHGNAVTAYVHWIGLEMTRGQACGGGYDRASAAIHSAASKIAAQFPKMLSDCDRDRYAQAGACDFLCSLINGPDGNGWTRNVENFGFTVCNVIC